MGLNRQRTGGMGREVTYAQLNSPSHRCGLVGHHLSLCSGRGSRIIIWRVVHPEKALLLGFMKMLPVLTFLEPKVIAK
jgi:hypothetical protein